MANLHFKTALDYVRRSPFQALSAVFVLTLTFFVTSLLAILIFSSNKVVKYFETRPQIIAFLKDEATAEEISALQNKYVSDPSIKEVKYVTKEEALAIYKQATSENPLLSELVSPSIFPASLEFSLSDLSKAQGLIEEIKASSIVDQVGFTASLGGESTLGDVVSRLRTITSYIRIGGGVFAGLLLVSSFMVLTIIISMRMTARRGEVEILNLIGATPGFIRSPILLEALIYAFSGVLIGWTLTFILTLYSAPGVIGYFADIPILPRDTIQLVIVFGVILLAELVLASALSTLGSLLAISRVKRR